MSEKALTGTLLFIETNQPQRYFERFLAPLSIPLYTVNDIKSGFIELPVNSVVALFNTIQETGGIDAGFDFVLKEFILPPSYILFYLGPHEKFKEQIHTYNHEIFNYRYYYFTDGKKFSEGDVHTLVEEFFSVLVYFYNKRQGEVQDEETK